jgi:DNA-binding response OmpR family regulator
MNGLILAERVRQSQPDLPVLLTTGFMDELVRQGSGAFGKDILTKPYRRSELAERVRAALARQHPGKQPATPGFRHEG